jgi:alkanesulfonate monooxygenase SsuD/methylene tetrahydromethanopterin reductase-like flavin-dependent oxidoreductase (luciferase family)
MKAYRDDVRARAAAMGRDPDDIKVLFLAAPVLGETDAEAQAKFDRVTGSDDFVKRALALYGSFTDIDFSRYDLDEPLPYLTTNGESGSLNKFCQQDAEGNTSGKTLRQLVRDGGTTSSIELIGSPETVADQMVAAMEQIGGDGFLIKAPFHRISRRYINEITEGLVPALQRRGAVRTRYEGDTLRAVLKEF